MEILARCRYSYGAGQAKNRQILFIKRVGYDVEALIYKLQVATLRRMGLVSCLTSKKIYIASGEGIVCPLRDFLVDTQKEIIKKSVECCFLFSLFNTSDNEIESITIHCPPIERQGDVDEQPSAS